MLVHVQVMYLWQDSSKLWAIQKLEKNILYN